MLREEAKRRLSALSERERSLRSRSLCARLTDTPGFRAAKAVLVYLALPEEVDLTDCIEAADEAGKRICVPRMDWSARTMEPLIVNWKSLKTEVREHGIAEPVGGKAASIASLDLILVPGLAFDTAGRRLGRGAGFYDRFLESFRQARRAKAAALGVCFESQLVPEIPADGHDQPVDGVVTERRVVVCRRGGGSADKNR